MPRVRALAYTFAVVGVNAFAVSYTFTDLQPNPTAQSSFAMGINNAGTVVGSYVQTGASYGYEYNGGTFTPINAPNTTVPGGIKPVAISNAGVIVGEAGSSGFITSGSVTTLFQIQGFTFFTATDPSGINSAGQVTVNITFERPPSSPSLYNADNGVFTSFPQFGVGYYTLVNGINDSGTVIGTYYVGLDGNKPYEYLNGKLIDLDVPGVPYGINNFGDIVGSSSQGGYLYSNGQLTIINDPAGANTVIHGINDKGQLVGAYQRNSETIGFLADPVTTPEPTSLPLATIGLFSLYSLYRAARHP